MTALRRSVRRSTQNRPDYTRAYGNGDDEKSDVSEASLDASDEDAAESSASADEWRPLDRTEREKRKRKGLKVLDDETSEEDEDVLNADVVDEDDELVQKVKAAKRRGAPMIVSKDKARKKVRIAESDMNDASKKRASAMSPVSIAKSKPDLPAPTGVQNRPASGLAQWLGVDPPAWPSTCPEAIITDRDSLFVGFVYTLNALSQNEITQCLSHLTKVVHPQVIPTDKLPPAMQHLAPSRRGSTHDMYAWRSLALKKGRNGLGGPDDFGLEEGQEDDGERFGAKEIAKAIRMYGATDVLVVVSRWYGGTMLGPVRFRHIEESAKAALARYLVDEAMVELKAELQDLDEKIETLRMANSSQSVTPAKAKIDYTNLDPDRAQRLITARKRQIELLSRSKSSLAVPVAAAVEVSEQRRMSVRPSVDPSEEEAALQALQEMEDLDAQSVISQTIKRENDDSHSKVVPLATESVEKVYVKAEPMDDVFPAKQMAAENINHVAPQTVKEEENETDLTGWDEL
jgi:hypothetical protein